VQGTFVFGYFGGPTFPTATGWCKTTDVVGFGSRVAATGASLFTSVPLPPNCGGIQLSGQGIAFVDDGASPSEGRGGEFASGGCMGNPVPPPPPPPDPPTAVGDVVVRLSSGEGLLRAYPADCTGACTAAWSLDTGSTFVGPMATVLDGAFLAVAATDGSVVVVDRSSHDVRFTGLAGAPIAQPVAADFSTIFATTTDRRLAAFHAGCPLDACEPSWTATLAAPASARVSIGGQVAYVGSTDGTVAAFTAYGCDAPVCEPLWTANVGAPVAAPPVISDGTLLVAATDGSLTAFTLP
jgi:hypothetical protein